MRPNLQVVFLSFLMPCFPLWAQTPPPGQAAPQTPPALSGSATVEEPAVMLEKMQVTTQTETFYNAIDRKVYNVGKDITSTTGTASDLLQNIPSVQVDVEGEVSLRGDENVTILINGRTSALMGKNPAEALEQMSADRIERVEIITNPSARYKPDGTGGIINIILKKEGDAGWSATARANAGNDDRYNGSLNASYNPGPFSVFGTLSFRRDNRPRQVQQDRAQLDGAGGVLSASSQHSQETSPNTSANVELGGTYRAGENTELGGSLSYGDRERTRDSLQTTTTRNAAGTITRDYNRARKGEETQKEIEVSLTLGRAFGPDGGELSVEVAHETETEEGEDRYTNRYRAPTQPDEHERRRNEETGSETELTADYTRAFSGRSKLEAGYALSVQESDIDILRATSDPGTSTWVTDSKTSNHFIANTTVHALYATYGHSLGHFGALAGLRYEHAETEANQVTSSIVEDNTYAKLYPSLHLTYDLTETQQLQLSYSHRVRRPDADDLNPYPSYDDPLNLFAGNPDLEPEDIHSVEAGWQYRRDDLTFLTAVYQRRRYNGITEVARLINNTTLLTTRENLASSRSTGTELGATARVQKNLAINFSANVYREQIEAENLGYASRRTATAWDAKLNANLEITKAWAIQTTSSYRAKRLTPQGERRPTHVTNIGARYKLPNRKTSLVLTVSDLFESLKNRTVLDTPTLRIETTRTRSSRVVFLGVIHQFGRSSKNSGNDLEFDDAM